MRINEEDEDHEEDEEQRRLVECQTRTEEWAKLLLLFVPRVKIEGQYKS